jgi:hypothetical protein
MLFGIVIVTQLYLVFAIATFYRINQLNKQKKKEIEEKRKMMS